MRSSLEIAAPARLRPRTQLHCRGDQVNGRPQEPASDSVSPDAVRA